MYSEVLDGILCSRDIDHRSEPFDCHYGSQVNDEDPRAWHVPRYYVYDPEKKTVRVMQIRAQHCRELIDDGKLACE